MMMALGRYAILILGALYWAGCCDVAQHEIRGSGNRIEERREVGDFSGVALMTVGDLEIEIADREELRIEAEDNLAAMIETKVVAGVLEIRQVGNTHLSPSKPVRYLVTLRRLDRVVHAAGGEVRIPGITAERLVIQHRGSGLINATNLEVEALSIHVSGSGNVEIEHVAALRSRLVLSGSGDVKIQDLVALSNAVRLTGSGDISISGGSVVEQSAILSGSGDLKGKGLYTTETEVMVSGSGSAFIHAQEQLDATITGRGGIRYRGNPHVIKSDSGSGRLRKIR